MKEHIDIFNARTTHVVFLLDESGSMSSVLDKTLDGFNKYVEDLKVPKGDRVLFTLRKFDTTGIKYVCTGAPVAEVPKLTRENFVPGLGTNLLDAIGDTINDMSADLNEAHTPIFVILTDGEENASTRFSYPKVQALIAARPKWTFVFMGADIDAYKIAANVGISLRNTMQYEGNNTVRAYAAMSQSTGALRASAVGATQNFFAKEEDKKP